ncbi:MAG: circadian clock kinase KaiC [Armatimonadetes bacterium]|jgi:circadian clock protein KaiC|nr:circadian clock kinase KaiC [Armatimonadota bacterium]
MSWVEAERSTELPDGGLPKAPSGIRGLDQVTAGGLPRGRATLVSGDVGCGKTLFGVEFLVRGAEEYNEPGVLMTFEETPAELTQNVYSLGFDLKRLVAEKKLSLHYVHIDRREIEVTGEYDLEGLFVRLNHAIDAIGAKRVVMDTIESIFSGFSNEAILRAELRRLFRWLKDKGVTTIITAESEGGNLSRHGLEEFLSDCVIRLDRRVVDEVSTRRMEIVKYRGSSHGANEYPFLIDVGGISILPITALGLEHRVSDARVSTGIPRLDEMLDGKGLFRGSSTLISGTAGSGKTSIAAHIVRAACERGERCLYFAFEESPDQIVRNVRSIGIDLQPWCERGLLQFQASRPTVYGLEMHLAQLHKCVEEFQPQVVVLDPLTNFVTAGTQPQVKGMLIRLIDYLKSKQITGVFSSLTDGGAAIEQSEVGVSSLIDTWILLRFLESGGERNRALYILKSRGMAHSNQVREFVMTGDGVDLVDVFLGPEGVLTGSARAMHEARERAEHLHRRQEVEARQRELERQRTLIERQIASLQSDFEAKQDEFQRLLRQETLQMDMRRQERATLARLRNDPAAARAEQFVSGNGGGDQK